MASSIRTLNPTTGKIEKEFKQHTSNEINQKIDLAENTFKTWRYESFENRKQIIKAVANELRLQREELARLITTEMGKPIKESRIEIDYTARIFDYYADNAEQFLQPITYESEKGDANIVSDPIGVLLGVMPWNFPFSQIVRFAAPNLMAGNTIVLKTASNIPQCAQAFEDLFTKVNAPKGIYQNLFVSGQDIAEIVKNDKIKGVSLTGSDAAGSSIAKIAGENIKKTVLELGGTDPMIILNDADLEKVINGTINGRLRNAGQACTSSKRIIVQEDIYDSYLEKIAAYVNQLKVDDPMKEDTDMGPISSASALNTLLNQVKSSVEQGAKLITGGYQIGTEGSFMAPTILTDLKPGMKAYHEEVFGPVLCLIKVKTVEEAITIANDTAYGLGASIYSENVALAQDIARKIESGMVYINKQVSSSPDLPFGGTKRSGYGRELSKEGITEFVNKKLILTSK